MHRLGSIYDLVTRKIVTKAARDALRNKKKTQEVLDFKANFKQNVYLILCRWKRGYYLSHSPEYSHHVIHGRNDKERYISSCSLEWRIVMHIVLILIEKFYYARVSPRAYNCIKGRGINARDKRGSLSHRLKHLIYDVPHEGYLQLDIRKCYPTTSAKAVFKGQDSLIKDKRIRKLLRNTSLSDVGLPIGTPTSPTNHHIVMLKVYRFIRENLTKDSATYADDIYMQGDMADLPSWKWRLRNFLYYECGYTTKKGIKICPSSVPVRMGGLVITKNEGKKVNEHNKGYCVLKKLIRKRILDTDDVKSLTSYIGQMMYSDSRKLEKKALMKYQDIYKKLQFKRRLDAEPIDIEKIEGLQVDIIDFEVRKPNKEGGHNWCRMVVAMPGTKPDGTPCRKARLVKGSYEGICIALQRFEKYVVADFAETEGVSPEAARSKCLPLEGVEFINDNGWVIKGTNVKLDILD